MRKIFLLLPAVLFLAGCAVRETPRFVRKNPEQMVSVPETVTISNGVLDGGFAPDSLGRMTSLKYRGRELLRRFERTALLGNPLFAPVNCNVYGFRELLWRVNMTALDLPVREYAARRNEIKFLIPGYGNTPLELERTVRFRPKSAVADVTAKFTNRGKTPFVYQLWLNLLPVQPYQPIVPLEDELKHDFKLGNNFHPASTDWIAARIPSADAVIALQWAFEDLYPAGMFYVHGAQDFNTFEVILGRHRLYPGRDRTYEYRILVFPGLPHLNCVMEETGIVVVPAGKGFEMIFCAAAPTAEKTVAVEFETGERKLTLPALKTGEIFKIEVPAMPEAVTLADGREFRIVPERARKKLRIVAFGDSITEGRTGVKLADNWLLKLGKKLGRKVSLYNAGVGGNSAREAMVRYESDVLARRPDVILLEFGGNNHDPAPERKRRRVSDREFRALLEKFKAGLPRNCKVVMITFPPIINEKHVYCKRVPGGKVDEELQNQRQIVRDFAKENGWPLLDLYKLIYPRRQEFILPDGVHLSPAGHTFFAEEAAKVLKETGYLDR